MEISLYRRYRPQRFSEVAGQSAAVGVVTGSLERSRVGHAYLFSGPRGCGKTTVARLLAKALNCLAPVNGYEPCCECRNCLAITAGESLDVVEIDGASNNSVDEVRELKSHVTLAPFASRYKIYIIDEVHMLSISAFNALLKTLEEPPGHVVFILATTEAHKVPVTIRSRCQHIPFRRIETGEIYERLAQVCGSESIKYEPEALREVARQADGALRDALSMLEQLSGLGKEGGISLSGVEAALGQGSRSSMERWFAAWHRGDMETFLELDRMLAGGASPQRFVEELFSLVRNLWLAARWKNILDVLDVSDQEKEYLKTEAPLWKTAELETAMRFLAELLPQVRLGLRIDVLSGLLMAKMAHLKDGPAEPSREPMVPRSLSAEPRSVPPLPPSSPSPSPSAPFASPPVSSASSAFSVSGSMGEKINGKAEPPTLEPAPAESSSSISIGAPSAAPLDSSGWTPCPEDRWNEMRKALREGNFPLYCALMDARPFIEKSTIEESTAEGSTPERLILDAAHRYCYEFSRLDRNRSLLKSLLAPLFEGEVLLRYEERWIACEVQAHSGAKKRSSGKRAAGKASQTSPDPDFSQPQAGFGQAEETGLPWTEPSEQPQAETPRSEDGGVPFQGLVREVQRWMQGDVILVRRGGEDEEAADEPPTEE